jgi:uncharacterized tellurite resistance protein B-like protein
MMNAQQHPLANYPEVERVDYLSIVASIASADGKVTDDEITKIREFCGAIGIGDIGIGMIIAAVEDPSVVDLQPILTRLSQTDLKFTLLTDMLFMAHADGIVVPGEEEEICKIASMLNITPEQIEAINKYVEAVISAQHADRSESDWKKLGCEIAGVLASTGVPLGAVAIAGTVFGDGLATGLMALGMGMGIATGAGVAVSIGVCSYFGVRWLFKKITGEER